MSLINYLYLNFRLIHMTAIIQLRKVLSEELMQLAAFSYFPPHTHVKRR